MQGLLKWEAGSLKCLHYASLDDLQLAVKRKQKQCLWTEGVAQLKVLTFTIEAILLLPCKSISDSFHQIWYKTWTGSYENCANFTHLLTAALKLIRLLTQMAYWKPRIHLYIGHAGRIAEGTRYIPEYKASSLYQSTTTVILFKI